MKLLVKKKKIHNLWLLLIMAIATSCDFSSRLFKEILSAQEDIISQDDFEDVTLQELGYGHVLSSSDKILELLKANNGILDIGDKSRPETITSMTGMSKKVFKKAIGDLYKKKLVLLEKEQVKLID